MGIIFLMIGISLFMGTCFLGAFFWAFRTGQFEDTCTPGMRILDYPSSVAQSTKSKTTSTYSE
jgi:cbb3-type cytochrome oxidase maturation protein